MNKAVMLSIQPEWCALIASKQKTVELRKTRPKIEPPFRCYIYETKKKVELLQTPRWIHHGCIELQGRGRVIGEFVCDEIEYLDCYGTRGLGFWKDNQFLTLKENMTHWKTGMSEGKAILYFNYKRGYAWHISDLALYAKPMPIDDFYYPLPEECAECDGNCIDCPFDCDPKQIKRPPQSWCYVKEVNE